MNEEQKREEERKRRQREREQRRRQQVMKQRLILGGAGALLLVIIIICVSVSAHNKKVKQEEAARLAQQKKTEQEAQEADKDNSIRIVAVGDNILDEAIIEAGKGDSDAWNYDFLYKNVESDIQAADLAAVSQETPYVNDHKEVSGTGLMGSPLEGGEALAKAGFDIVAQATNHAFDKGSVGIINTCTYWQTKHPEMQFLGIHADQEESSNRVKIIDKKNFKIALLNYTYGVDEEAGFSDGDSYMVDVYSEDRAKEDVAQAKSSADFVMVFLHAGGEYTEEPSDTAQARVDFLAEQGVDALLCSNPHVVQSYGMMDRSDGGKMLLYNSLGNFVSADNQMPGLIGGMADFTLKKDASTNAVTVENYSIVPLVMHYNNEKTEFAVYKLADYTEELAAAHGIHQETGDTFTLESIKAAAEKFQTPSDFRKTEGEEDGKSSDEQSADGAEQDSDSKNIIKAVS